MKKKRNRYDGEFKLNSVKLVLTSKGERTMKAIAEDLGINYWVPVQWKKEYEKFGEAAFLGKRPAPCVRIVVASPQKTSN
jgi:transposase-like protein